MEVRQIKLLAAVGLSLIFSSCTSRSVHERLQILQVPISSDSKTLDPAEAYDTISWKVLPNIYETLYQYSYLKEDFKVEPLLAADMPKFSKDRLTVTIPIRRGIKFHDDEAFPYGKGRELKAQDFIYGFKRVAMPWIKTQGWWIFDNKIVGFNQFREMLKAVNKENRTNAFAQPVKGLTALDDYTLQIKLTKPYPQLLYILTMPFTSPVAHEVIAKHGDELGNIHMHPVGTGPFVLKLWHRGHKIHLIRNSTYRNEIYPTQGDKKYMKLGFLADAGKPIPFLDEIKFAIVEQSQPQWLNFLKGNFDIIGIPKDNFSEAIVDQINMTPKFKKMGISLTTEASTVFYFVAFNMLDSLVGKSKFLRQAFSSAIDRKKWIELFTNNRGKEMTTALPPGIEGRVPEAKTKYKFDLAKAKKLLAQAGYPKGKGLPVLKFDMRGADTVNRQMGDFFTHQLAKIGIQLKIVYNTFPAFLEKMKHGNLQVSYGGWALDYPDAENVYQLLYGPNKAPGPNDTNFDYPLMNRLYEKMAVMLPNQERSKLIKRMDDILQEEVPWAFGYYKTQYSVSQPWIKNYRTSQIILNQYKYVRIDKKIQLREIPKR